MSQNTAHWLEGEADTSSQANTSSSWKDCGERQEGKVWPRRRSSRPNFLGSLRRAASGWKSVTRDGLSTSQKRTSQAEARAGAKVLRWQREQQFRRTKGHPDDPVRGMNQWLE